MGVDTNLHIGPYMSVKGKKTEMVDCEVKTCSNKKCSTYKENQDYKNMVGKFCAECGSILEMKKYKEKNIIYPSSLLYEEPYGDELCDELCFIDPMSGEGGLFISNENSPFDKKRIKTDDDDENDLTNVNTKEEIE